MSDSLRPHGLEVARLFCPWDFPGKNTGVGCISSPGDLPDTGIKQLSHIWQLDSIPQSHMAHTKAIFLKHKLTEKNWNLKKRGENGRTEKIFEEIMPKKDSIQFSYKVFVRKMQRVTFLQIMKHTRKTYSQNEWLF